MIETAENLRREYRIPRAGAGRVRRPLAPAGRRRAGRGPVRRRDRARHRPRAARATPSSTATSTSAPTRTVEVLARLRPIMGRDDPDATVTAGNASGQNDGAAVCIVTTPDKAAELGLRPLVRLVSWAVAGVPPATMGIGPVPATAKALDAAGPHPGRHRPHRAQRGLRRPGPRRHPRMETHPDRLRPAQRQRLRHLAGPPRRRHRRPHPGHPRPRDAPPPGPLRPRDHVHRRRPGPRRRLRARLLNEMDGSDAVRARRSRDRGWCSVPAGDESSPPSWAGWR